MTTAQNDKARFAHFGDPCMFCGVGHDDLAPGPCPKNDGKVRVAHYAVVDRRWDGVERYRYRTTDGKVHEVSAHISFKLPYWHFGYCDDFVNPPKWDEGLKTAQVTA